MAFNRAQLCCLFFFLRIASVVGQLSWEEVNVASQESPPARREGGVAFDEASGTLALFGGRSGSSLLGDFWVFSLNESVWRQLDITRPQARFNFVYAFHNSTFVIFGGESRSSFALEGGGGDARVFLNDVWTWRFGDTAWRKVDIDGATADSGDVGSPPPRYGAAGGMTRDGSLLVTHGFRSGQRFDDTWILDGVTETETATNGNENRSGSRTAKQWRRIDAARPPSKRCLLAGAIVPSTEELVIFGGCGSGGYGPCPDSSTFFLPGSTIRGNSSSLSSGWRSLGPCPQRRMYASMAAFGEEHVVMFGGDAGPAFGGAIDEEKEGREGQNGVGFVWALHAQQQIWSPVNTVGSVGVGARVGGMLSAGFGTATTIDAATNISSPTYRVFLFGGVAEKAPGSSALLALVGRLPSSFPYSMSQCASSLNVDLRHVHGVLMALAWGLFLPAGAFIARFGKRAVLGKRSVLGRIFGATDAWFPAHRALQLAGLALSCVGVVIAFLSVGAGHLTALPHAPLGIVILAGAIGQATLGLCEPDYLVKNAKRTAWEHAHRWLGRILLLGAVVQIGFGIDALATESRTGLFGFYAAILVFYALLFTVFTYRNDVRSGVDSADREVGMRTSSRHS